MIYDQLVENVTNLRIRERLLLHDKLTLADAVTIAQKESAGEHSKAITNTQNFCVQTVSLQKHAKVHGSSALGI